MSPLLALPDEILAQIVLLLPTPDILHSRLVCFKLSSIISSSVEIQYRIALETSGLEDNGTCSSFSPSEKLSKLLRGQKAWRKFKPQFIKPVKVQHLPSGIYDLSGGIYLLGSDRMLDLDYAVLPERDGEDAEWKSIELQETYLDMGLCIDEHDLVAIITTTPFETTGMFDIALHIKQFSTGQPHPGAKQPRISAFKSEYARPGIGIEIVGDNLVLILSYQRDRNATLPDRLFVFDWRSGVLKTSLVAPNRSYSGLIFLDENLLLLPNTRRGALEIWDLPRTASAPSPSAPVCILELPLLAPGRSFGQLSCRAEPNPMGANRFRGTKNHAERRQQRPYRCKAEDAIIIFNVRIQPLHAGPHPVVALGFSHVYTFFVHRKSILQIVEEQKQREAMPPTIDIDFPSNSLLFPPPIIWDQWGQKITRWIEADDMATRWITTTSGQRAALISSHARSSQGSGSPIVVMDFNPWSVKKVQHALLKKKRKLEATAERKRRQVQMRLDQQNAEIVRKFRECKEWVERIERELGDIKAAAELGSSRSRSPKLRYTTSTDPIDFPRLDHSNVAEIKTFLEDHSEFVEHLDVPPAIQARAESSRTHQYEDSLMDELDSDGDDSDASSSKGDTERASWSLTGSHTVDRAGVCFSSPVESELPCVCYSSSQHFHYDGALVDEERVLGIKTNALDRIEEFDVHYFG
ncbi:hypothetical protein FA13DRAFT_1010701 [Coprinellus micaceus]|uniref:F-box domain-containing protein n=1 Tax=Coprinellus micaceus TaxID=71717 RepID=A0A4Y7SY21_COPMI|nr:hypothetical protein FA13DRAFT_1010701 [Coprinellus micaceus]